VPKPFRLHQAWVLAAAVSVAACAAPPVQDNTVVDVLFQSAASAEQGAEYAAAAQHYQKLFARDPENPVIVFALARNLRYSGAAAEATRLLQGAAAKIKTEPGFRLALGKSQLASGETRPAIANFKSALSADPENWEIHSTLGIALDLSDDFAAAQQSYRRALALSPKNPSVLNNMAISLALSGDLAGAISTIKDAPQVARHNPQIRQNLALFYGIKGDVKKAKALAKIDLDDDAVAKNLEVYSQLRRK